MRKRARVEYDEGASLIGSLNAIDEFCFGIALKGLEFMAKVVGPLRHVLLDLRQCRGAIRVGLSRTQQVQIRAVD